MKEFIDTISFDHINISIWKSISNHLIENDYKKKKQKDELKKDDESRYKGIVFNREEGKEFNGIIKFIKDKIKFTASSIEENCIPENILYLDDWKYFHSQYNQNNWICIDFKENQIIPTSYEIKSYPFGINEQHPKSWVIEASNNKISWFVVDEIKDCNCLNGRCVSHVFQIKNKSWPKFRYLRMRLTGPNCLGLNPLAINEIEFYGILFK